MTYESSIDNVLIKIINAKFKYYKILILLKKLDRYMLESESIQHLDGMTILRCNCCSEFYRYEGGRKCR